MARPNWRRVRACSARVLRPGDDPPRPGRRRTPGRARASARATPPSSRTRSRTSPGPKDSPPRVATGSTSPGQRPPACHPRPRPSGRGSRTRRLPRQRPADTGHRPLPHGNAHRRQLLARDQRGKRSSRSSSCTASTVSTSGPGNTARPRFLGHRDPLERAALSFRRRRGRARPAGRDPPSGPQLEPGDSGAVHDLVRTIPRVGLDGVPDRAALRVRARVQGPGSRRDPPAALPVAHEAARPVADHDAPQRRPARARKWAPAPPSSRRKACRRMLHTWRSCSRGEADGARELVGLPKHDATRRQAGVARRRGGRLGTVPPAPRSRRPASACPRRHEGTFGEPMLHGLEGADGPPELLSLTQVGHGELQRGVHAFPASRPRVPRATRLRRRSPEPGPRASPRLRAASVRRPKG